MAITREITLTGTGWQAVCTPTDGPVQFEVNASYVWAIAESSPSVTGFTGASGVMVQLLPNTVNKQLWIKGTTNNKVQIQGGATPV